jgi:pimeloyl-ACP methyl ester carboxylesterase
MTSTKFSLRFFRDKRVNGRADLPDFFPVWLDLSEALALLDAMPGGGRIEIKLRHDRNALAYVPTALSTNDAGAFLVAEVTGIASAATRKITADGVALPGVFADAVRADPSKGVILIEGRAATTSPLVLEIWRKGKKVLEKSLPLRVAPVEQMYTRVNLRDGAAAVTPGSCLPPANGTNVVFLHGYNVDAETARDWHSEMFKRLWQSGSKARFHAVTWRGDIGGINGFHYHEDVVSAFETAPHLKNYASRLFGQKVIVMAHSLGNMVVSSAIADHGMGVHKYFMLNAAVASEAFDANLWNDSPSNVLVHEDWRDYTNVCWSTKWHMFFVDNSDDARACLTWKDRFVGVLSKTTAYNFFSSGDEVFELYDGTPYTTSGMSSSNRRYAWHKQETHKGCGAIDPAGTSWSGWRFRLIEVKMGVVV